MIPGNIIKHSLHFLCNLRMGQLYTIPGWKGLSWTNNLAYQFNSKVIKKVKCWEYNSGTIFITLHFLCNFISLITYKWTQYASLLLYTRLGRLARDKYSSLLGPFLSCEENKML
jgi:hypothetical protein